MIAISKSTGEEIKEFNDREWVDADNKYYGNTSEWIKEKYVFKAEEDGKIVGAVIGKYEEGVLYIDDVIVAKNKRNLGVGKALVKKAEMYGKEMGGHKAYLITGKTWQVRKFYESLGFVKTGELKNHYRHVDFVIYEKLL
ncbi:MAG: GNAT family N-acetyltransferase [Patescibacteria group bacterium]|nr:GNAT family N-acetyltransferase [Patescibacteria group bacterium]